MRTRATHPKDNRKTSKITHPMKLTLLGTGTSQGVPTIGCRCEVCRSTDTHDQRLRTSAMLEVGECRIVIDCDEKGRVLYEGLRDGFSGYVNRAALQQQIGAGDVRNMVIRPELQELWDKEVVPKIAEKHCDYIQISVAFCEQAKLRGYTVVYDPELVM